MIEMQQFPEKVTELWNNWEIRVMVLLSLKLQIVLLIFGSQWKYNGTWIRLIVWSAYSSADIMATVALSNLARSQGDLIGSSLKPNNLIQVFWAPFLLLHLGGPDTITSYSTEDNELWLRHLLNLIYLAGVAFYILVRSSGHTALIFLVIPVFITGIIKYSERIFALWSSTTKNIRDSLLSVRPVTIANTVMVVPRERNFPANNYLHEAYYLFKMSICLFEDLTLSLTELKDSIRAISSVKSPKDVFILVEVELGFMYDMLHTKGPIVSSCLGIFLHCISFLSSITTFVAFSIIIEKHVCTAADISVTYLLLVGALFVEVYAFFYLIFSDRTMIWLTKFKNPTSNSICGAIYSLHTYLANGKRWSGSMAQFNTIGFCCKSFKLVESAKYIFDIYEMMQRLIQRLHMNWEDVNDELKDLIFKHLLKKKDQIMMNVEDTDLRNNLVAQRGDGVLKEWEFQWSIRTTEFNHSVLIWHIATDICYYKDLDVSESYSKRKTSKCLSDYLCYILVMKPYMLPKDFGDIVYRYKDTEKEVMRILKQRQKTSDKETRNELLRTITEGSTNVGADESGKSVLVDGCNLAKQLQSLGLKKWEMVSEVWIEMLAYAATHCEWKEHIRQLRKGGELLTHVCLLMAHLGLSQQYQVTDFERQGLKGISY